MYSIQSTVRFRRALSSLAIRTTALEFEIASRSLEWLNQMFTPLYCFGIREQYADPWHILYDSDAGGCGLKNGVAMGTFCAPLADAKDAPFCL